MEWFPLAILQSSQKLVRICRGIMKNLHPHRSETNGIAERAVRRVKEVTSSLLVQSGSDEQWWEKQWTVIVIHETFKKIEQMGKRLAKEDTTLHSVTREYLVEHRFYHSESTKVKNKLHHPNSKSLQKYFLLDML